MLVEISIITSYLAAIIMAIVYDTNIEKKKTLGEVMKYSCTKNFLFFFKILF